MNEREIKEQAAALPRGMDHGNLAGSALMLVLLRPHLYMSNPVPLRLLGYPPPLVYLVEDLNPRSGRGADNKRTNLIEALCAYWYHSSEEAALTSLTPMFQTTLENALVSLLDAWHLMRVRVDKVLPCGSMATISAYQILGSALQVEDNVVMW